MATGLNPDRERCYVPKGDRDKKPADWSRFYYRPQKARERSNQRDRLSETIADGKEQTARTHFLGGSRQMELLMTCFTRWENFLREDGAEIHWPERGTADKEAALDALPVELFDELFDAVSNADEFTEEQAKNSDSPSGSPAPGTTTAVGPTSASAA